MQIERGPEEIDCAQLRIATEREMDPSVSSDVMSIGSNCIRHRVSKMDTLAGIAIKYGVEVADIKRLNGLVTDLQMFAHNSLQIPLPGRHPPSSVCQGGSSPEQDLNHGHRINVFTSFQSLKLNSFQRDVSPAMSSLQGYYGLNPSDRGAAEGEEMAVHINNRGHQYLEDALQHKKLILSDPNPSPHRRSRSFANDFPLPNGGLVKDLLVSRASGSDTQKKSNGKLEYRQSQAEIDQACHTPVLLLKDDSSNCSGFSGITGNSVALRRAAPSADTDSGRMNPVPVGTAFTCEGFSGFRKSSSLSNLQDSENGSSPWPTFMWTKRSDLQATSSGSATRMIFDGLPKPTTIRRNKAAID